MTRTPSEFDHERYEELCALATARALTPAESAMLLEHLDECGQCSHHFDEYQSLASEGIPMLSKFRKQTLETSSFDEQKALARLLKNVETLRPSAAENIPARWRVPLAQMLCGLVAASLVVGLVFESYKLGEHRQSEIVAKTVSPSVPAETTRSQTPNSDTSSKDREQEDASLRALALQRNQAQTIGVMRELSKGPSIT